MTIERRDKKDTQYGNWIRNNDLLDSRKYGFDAQNLDYIWFNFREGWYILIEEKRKLAKQSIAQKDTHGILNQHLKSIPIETKVNTFRGFREIEYRGYFLIQFQNTNPNDSKWCLINGVKYYNPASYLLFLHKFGILLEPDIDLSVPAPVIAKMNKITVSQAQVLQKGREVNVTD